MSAAKRKGTEREHAVRDLLVDEGWVVYRGAASLGCADLVALRSGCALLIQVKANRSGGPYSNFRRAERAALLAEAARAGAEAKLVHWPLGRGGKPAWYGPDDWP